jgi:hypothetical protein
MHAQQVIDTAGQFDQAGFTVFQRDLYAGPKWLDGEIGHREMSGSAEAIGPF